MLAALQFILHFTCQISFFAKNRHGNHTYIQTLWYALLSNTDTPLSDYPAMGVDIDGAEIITTFAGSRLETRRFFSAL